MLVVFCILSSAMLQGDVMDSAANGFTVKIATVIRDPDPANVYNKLVHQVGDWWSSDHTFSHDAHNLSIDDKPLGCFCEKMPAGGGVRHMQVLMVMPDKMLVMSGGLGPLQKMAAIGTMTIAILPLPHETRVELTYAVGGYLPDGLNTWASPVDKMLTEQMGRLKRYVETGSAEGAKKTQ
jgi:hypothetical protein